MRSEAKSLISHLDIELTDRCNNDCIHCCINLPEDDARAKKRELTTDQWKDILIQAAALGVLTVRFTGGEPLLREDFAELYLHARYLGLKVLLFTNACKLTPELAALFARVPPLERVEVSAYGMSRKSYEAVSRQPGSYAQFRQGVARLLRKKIPFVVKGIWLPANKAEVDRFESWAATIPWMDMPPSQVMILEMRGRRDSEKKNRAIAALRASPQEIVSFLNRRRALYRKEMTRFCRRFMGAPGRKLFDCGAGRGACVDAYGWLQPCLSLRAPALSYDLKKNRLRDVLRNEFPKLKRITAANHDYLARCSRCFLKGLCEQCPAKSWAEHGTLDTPVDYLCAVAHEQARDLGLLHEGEKAWQVRDWRRRLESMEG